MTTQIEHNLQMQNLLVEIDVMKVLRRNS